MCPVNSSNRVQPLYVRSLNSNKSLRLIIFGKTVRPIDARKSVCIVNSNKPAYHFDF